MISIDPGVNGCGVAVFRDDGSLERAFYARPSRIELGLFFTEYSRGVVRIEFPRIYRAASQKGDQNDLMQLARVAGRLEAWAQDAGHTVELVYPRDWKGTLDGDAMVERIKERLTDYERNFVQLPSAKSLGHNVYDGIGIGLQALGRLEPRKVIPR